MVSASEEVSSLQALFEQANIGLVLALRVARGLNWVSRALEEGLTTYRIHREVHLAHAQYWAPAADAMEPRLNTGNDGSTS